jgi:hypothetical protein
MKHTPARTTNGFAIELTDQTDLGLAMLILETEDGQHQPIAVAATIGEAKEMARHDFAGRLRELEAGGDPLCPHGYKVWARGVDGEYRIAAEIGVPRSKKRI